MKNSIEKYIAQFITIAFQPLLVPIYGLLLLATSGYMDYYLPYQRYVIYGITLMFTTLIPVLIILFLYKKGIVSTPQISKRNERTLPYLFTLMSVAILLVILNLIQNFPLYYLYVIYGYFMSVAVMLFVNTWWKISAHMNGIGGLFGAVLSVTYYFQDNFVWVYVVFCIVTGVVAYARLSLDAHSPAQLLAGFLVGIACLAAYPMLIMW